MAHRVLLVDDQPEALKVAGLALHREGYEVTGTQSGREALEKIERERPDLVVLDVMMPDMNGTEVCQRIRQTPAMVHLPIIMLTALGEERDKLAGFDVGADDYLVKPVSLRELSARVKALLARTNGSPAAAPTRQRARILAFIGVKGGVGTTTLAVNTALAAVQDGLATILVDLHAHGGGAAAQLGHYRSRKTLSNLLELKPEGIEPGLVEHHLLSHQTGLRILPAPPGPMGAHHELTAKHVERILAQLSGMADLLVLDLAPALDRGTEAALRLANRVALVSERDHIALQMTQDWLDALDSLGPGGGSTSVIVVNRGKAATALTRSDLEGALKRDLLALIVPAPEMTLHANRIGTPVLLQERDTPIETQLRAVARSLIH